MDKPICHGPIGRQNNWTSNKLYSQTETGISPPKKLKKFIDTNERILGIGQSYETRTKTSLIRRNAKKNALI